MSIFGSIGNFAKMYNYNSGFDDDQKVLTYALLPKLHGTNGSIRIGTDGTIEARSKNRVLSLNSDNHGFAQHVLSKKVGIHYGFHSQNNEIILWGEWCGQGIHRGANDMVCKLEEKEFFVFAIQVDSTMHTDLSRWALSLEQNGFQMITPIEEVNIPFNHSIAIEPVVQKVNKIVEAMEKEDFFIKSIYSDLEGCGEGLVGVLYPFSEVGDYFQYAFKAKTEAHRVKGTKMPAAAMEPLPQDALAFSTTYVTKARIQQAVDELQLPMDMSSTKDILAWVSKDIIKEGEDDILAMNTDWKRLSKFVSKLIIEQWKEMVKNEEIISITGHVTPANASNLSGEVRS